jgi:hypothetical protein
MVSEPVESSEIALVKVAIEETVSAAVDDSDTARLIIRIDAIESDPVPDSAISAVNKSPPTN